MPRREKSAESSHPSVFSPSPSSSRCVLRPLSPSREFSADEGKKARSRRQTSVVNFTAALPGRIVPHREEEREREREKDAEDTAAFLQRRVDSGFISAEKRPVECRKVSAKVCVFSSFPPSSPPPLSLSLSSRRGGTAAVSLSGLSEKSRILIRDIIYAPVMPLDYARATSAKSRDSQLLIGLGRRLPDIAHLRVSASDLEFRGFPRE